MDVVHEFGYAKVSRGLSLVQLLLDVEVLQPLMVCVEIHLNTY